MDQMEITCNICCKTVNSSEFASFENTLSELLDVIFSKNENKVSEIDIF